MENKSKTRLIADRYEVRRAIGSGGVGAVFEAWDTQLRRRVAIKRWNAPEPMLDDPAGTERLWREAMTLASIQHPNILTIHDFGVDDEGPYVITEYVDGETLDRVVERGALDREAFAEAAQQILEALIAAHQSGMIHRDIKPQNIMRTRLASGAWQYKILDFGLARFVSRPTVQSLEGNTAIYGSILYIAPEQLRHQPLDARTDIYAVGCLCYYMLAGRNAVEGDSIPALITSHLEHRVTPLAEIRPELPPELCAWVMKAMAFDPADRFASASAALAALGNALPGLVRKTTIRITLPGAITPHTAPPPSERDAPLPAFPRKTGPVAPPPPRAPRCGCGCRRPPPPSSSPPSRASSCTAIGRPPPPWRAPSPTSPSKPPRRPIRPSSKASSPPGRPTSPPSAGRSSRNTSSRCATCAGPSGAASAPSSRSWPRTSSTPASTPTNSKPSAT